MRKIRPIAILIALIALPMMTAGGGCPEEAVDEECTWNGECDDNSAPELYSLVYSVNGGSLTTEPPSIYSTDRIMIACSYSDAEGNITGGQIFLNDSNPDYTYSGDINVELGCSTETTGVRFGYQLDGSEEPLAVGYHNVEMYWTDACGYASNKMQGSFYVN